MTHPEASVETLSAYLDGELPPEEAARVEELLEQDPDARLKLDGMRSIVHDLRHLERMAPPPTLGQDVTRRIALAGERRSLLDRIEDGLSGLQTQSNTFLMFAVIFALALIMYFFSHALEKAGRESLVPVTFDDPPGAGAELTQEEIDAASTILVGGRLFQRTEAGPWVEEGLEAEEISGARRLDLVAEPEILESHPELGGVARLGHAFLHLDGEVVELIAESRGGR